MQAAFFVESSFVRLISAALAWFKLSYKKNHSKFVVTLKPKLKHCTLKQKRRSTSPQK